MNLHVLFSGTLYFDWAREILRYLPKEKIKVCLMSVRDVARQEGNDIDLHSSVKRPRQELIAHLFRHERALMYESTEIFSIAYLNEPSTKKGCLAATERNNLLLFTTDNFFPGEQSIFLHRPDLECFRSFTSLFKKRKAVQVERLI